MKEMTTRQWLLIAKMQMTLNINFKGSTMEEASKFISEHMDLYKQHEKSSSDIISK